MIRISIAILVALIAPRLFGQIDQATINLNDSIRLVIDRSIFDTTGKHIEYYDSKWAYAIDGSPFFGSDGEIPKYQLQKAILIIGQTNYDLQIDHMYEPWFGNKPDEKYFKIRVDGTEIRLRGIFSDAAGTYGAEWLIIGKSSVRTILTRDDRILIEYFNIF